MKLQKLLSALPIAIVTALLFMNIMTVPVGAADVELDEYGEYVGEDITISGYGFYPNSAYSIIFPNAWNFDDIEAKTSSSGEFVKHFEVPEKPGNTYKIYIDGYDSSNHEFSKYVSFTIESYVEGMVKNIQVGDKYTLSGSGFAGGDYIYIYFDDVYDENDSDTYVKVKTKSNGTFSSFSYTIPEIRGGAHDFIIIDDDNNMWEQRITAGSKITADSDEAAIGEIIKISGTGFGKASPISFYIDDNKLDITATSNDNGSFENAEIIIPGISSGKHTLRASDIVTNYANLVITTLQAIDITPVTGPAETLIEVSGEGFPSNTAIYLSMAGIDLGNTRSDATGFFSTQVNAPKLPSGNYKLLATDGNRISSATFAITNGVVLNQTSGNTGDNITADGYGFNTKASIAIKFDGVDIAAATSNSDGEFTAVFTIPPAAAGEHQLIITDGINPIILVFEVKSTIEINKTSGNIGMMVDIKGKAFKAGTTATVSYDDNEVTTTEIDENGSFSVTFTVPASKAGDHTITITDGINVGTGVFTVESNSPPVPNVISPANLSKTSSQPVFNWETVTDPSGVSYRLQIATDSDFASIIADKSKISGNSYALTEKLNSTNSESPYYWRIKAIDGASNESGWSASQTFIVGISMMVIIIIAAAAVILIAAGWMVYSKFFR